MPSPQSPKRLRMGAAKAKQLESCAFVTTRNSNNSIRLQARFVTAWKISFYSQASARSFAVELNCQKYTV